MDVGRAEDMDTNPTHTSRPVAFCADVPWDGGAREIERAPPCAPGHRPELTVFASGQRVLEAGHAGREHAT